MYPEEFIEKLKEQIIDDNLVIYKKIYESTIIDEKVEKDPYYGDALVFYRSLPTKQKEIIFKIIQQTIIDTTSAILGIIDGPVSLEGVNGDFILIYKAPNEVENLLSGDLQTDFLNTIYSE